MRQTLKIGIIGLGLEFRVVYGYKSYFGHELIRLSRFRVVRFARLEVSDPDPGHTGSILFLTFLELFSSFS